MDHAPTRTLDTLCDLYGFWVIRAFTDVAATYLGRIPHSGHARAMWLDGVVEYTLDGKRAAELIEPAIRLAEETGDEATLVDCLHWYGMSLAYMIDPDLGRPHLERGLELATQADDHRRTAWLLCNLALCAQPSGKQALARGQWEAALELFTSLGHRWGRVVCLIGLAWYDEATGGIPRLAELLIEARQEAAKIGYLWGSVDVSRMLAHVAVEEGDAGWATQLVDEAWEGGERLMQLEQWEPCLLTLRARVALLTGDLGAAVRHLSEATDLFANGFSSLDYELDDLLYTAAAMAGEFGDHARAAILIGAATVHGHTVSVRSLLGGRRTVAGTEGVLLRVMGSTEFDQYFRSGLVLTQDEALATVGDLVASLPNRP